MKPWFERYPGRLEYELEELAKAGYKFSLNEQKKAEGQVVVEVKYQVAEATHNLVVCYPDLYPWLPFDIFGPTLPPGRHISPNTGNLCLMEKPHTTWCVELTLLWALEEQVKAIVQAHLDVENTIEAQEGQQFSGYYSYATDSIMLVSDWNLAPQYTYGRLVIGLEFGSNPQAAFRGAVLEVQDATGRKIVELDQILAKRYQKKIHGRWVRVGAPPKMAQQDDLSVFDEAIKRHASINTLKLDSGLDIVGFLYPEESSYKTSVENWLFALRTKKSESSLDARHQAALIRADSVHRENLLARVPSLAPLRNKKVVLIGAGAIGSIIAWQLARAGLGSLSLIDHDFVQVGNSPRWLLGLPAVGRTKVMAVAHDLMHHYPYTTVDGALCRLGTPKVFDNHYGDFQVLGMFMEQAHLVIDATAEKCLSMAISELCREKGLPYVWATGTPGSRGGVVGRVLPGKTKGCWKCFQSHMNDGAIITPAHETQPGIQPKGCFHPTFTGTGFDMDNIALAATRVAVSVLSQDEEGGYPHLEPDVSVLNLWDEQQNPIFPNWISYPLLQHPSCPDHA